MPFYEEVAHIPMVIYHPRFAQHAGERRKALTQTIDLMPTFLDWFGIELPEHVEGSSLTNTLGTDAKVRDAAIFGMFGAATNVVDGRYAYFRYPEDLTAHDLYEYTLMPMRQKALFEKSDLREATLTDAFRFTDGVPVLKLPARRNAAGQPCGHAGQGFYRDTETVLFDLANDPGQQRPINDPVVIARLEKHLHDILTRNEAPIEAFTRLGLDPPERAVSSA